MVSAFIGLVLFIIIIKSIIIKLPSDANKKHANRNSVGQEKIKNVMLTVSDTVPPSFPPDPNETDAERRDRERHERIQREEAARR